MPLLVSRKKKENGNRITTVATNTVCYNCSRKELYVAFIYVNVQVKYCDREGTILPSF